MSDNKNGRGFGGKGYYIALILCAAAIGITGYVYYQNTPAEQTHLPADTPVSATDDLSTLDGSDAPVLATRPQASTAPTETGEATEPTAGKLSTCAPVEGTVTAEYAMECLSYNQTTRDWRTHNGVDIAAQAGADVVAAADGQVYTVYDDDEMGTTVVIRHDGGYVTKYSSLASEVPVHAGDTVSMGQVIGHVGSTAMMESALGDHVHFCVTLDDEPVDPMAFIEG